MRIATVLACIVVAVVVGLVVHADRVCARAGGVLLDGDHCVRVGGEP